MKPKQNIKEVLMDQTKTILTYTTNNLNMLSVIIFIVGRDILQLMNMQHFALSYFFLTA